MCLSGTIHINIANNSCTFNSNKAAQNGAMIEAQLLMVDCLK